MATELAYVKLTDDEIQSRLTALSGWNVENGQLTKTYQFDAYQKGLVFATAVGFLADTLNHHPDLLVTYGKVKVSVNTHDVGGLSPYDFELARRINAIA